MEQHVKDPATNRLAAFVGEWSMVAEFKDAPPADGGARVVFEWMPGKRFLIERWEAPIPEPLDAPAAGIAIIGADPETKARATSSSTISNSRGVARVYKMSVSDGVWKLWRESPDFSPAALLSALDRHLRRRWQDHHRILGDLPLGHDLGARL